MTVQTTFAGGISPWAHLFKSEPVDPSIGKPRNGKITINVDNLVVRNENRDVIEFSELLKYSHLFDKIKPGYSMECDRADITKVTASYQQYRKDRGIMVRVDVCRQDGIIRIRERKPNAKK